MNNLDLNMIYKKIDFINRFKKISVNHNDFKNSLTGNDKEMYDRILSKFIYSVKYLKKETFYKIEEKWDNITFIFQLGLKNGIVEPILYIKLEDKYIGPDHRFDSICEKLDDSFSRREFPIPVYSSEEELEEILTVIFEMYEDFKTEFIKQNRTDD